MQRDSITGSSPQSQGKLSLITQDMLSEKLLYVMFYSKSWGEVVSGTHLVLPFTEGKFYWWGVQEGDRGIPIHNKINV